MIFNEFKYFSEIGLFKKNIAPSSIPKVLKLSFLNFIFFRQLFMWPHTHNELMNKQLSEMTREMYKNKNKKSNLKWGTFV
jgi:hypothetical protein